MTALEYLEGHRLIATPCRGRLDAPLIRSILVSYFSTVQRSLNNSAPKAIMLYMVKGIHDSIYQVRLAIHRSVR